MQAHIVHTQAKPLASRGHIHWFLLVGCMAAAVHWGVVVGLVERFGWPPLGANVLGWLTAVGVSFTGHHVSTFRGHGAPLLGAASRFLALSAFGFLINESAYAVLLRWGSPRYGLVLAAVLVGVAVITYLAGRFWVFARRPGSSTAHPGAKA